MVRLDPQRHLLDFASAGHLPSLLLNHSGETKFVMESTGIPLGIMRDYKFSKGEPVTLSAGDTVLLLTDGITEAQALDKTEFDFDRTIDTVKTHQQKPAHHILEHLYQEVRAFSENKPQEDDITAIICKVNSWVIDLIRLFA